MRVREITSLEKLFEAGVHPDPEKIRTTVEMLEPGDKKYLQRALLVSKLPRKICSKSVSKYKDTEKPVRNRHSVAVGARACKRVGVAKEQLNKITCFEIV